MKLKLWSAFAALLVIMLILTACDPPGPPPRPTRTLLPSLAPSPTVDPVLPTVDPNLGAGINDPLAAAAPNEGDVEHVVSLPPDEPFQAVSSSDGLRLRGTLFRAAQEPAPALLLLHALDGRKEDWMPLVTPLQQGGYTVLAVDLRGQGVTGGTSNWTLARQDTLDLLEALRLVDGVDALRVGVIGADIGGNLALAGCAVTEFCRVVAMLSPGLDYGGVTSQDAVMQLRERPLLLVASQEDSYAAQSAQALVGLAGSQSELVLYDGAGHGTTMLQLESRLAGVILAWLQTHM